MQRDFHLSDITSPAIPTTGSRAFAVAAMAFGVIALIWRDFATVWHPLGNRDGHRVRARRYRHSDGDLRVLAAQLLTVILASFGLLIWLPSLIRHPHEHIVWVGNTINLAVTAAAWMIAESLRR